MANEAALLELVNVIGEANERGEWNQFHWARKTECGTSMCAAGWKCAIDGKKFEFLTNFPEFADNITDGTPIVKYATAALDLTRREAAVLFYGTGNNYDDLVATVKSIINGDYR